jgi:predicted GIY-YIG superfamily endonuclease
MYYIYLLKSLSSGVYYVGMAKDIQMRLKEHNSGKSRYTKGHQPFELIYQEGPFATVEAREREKYLKRSDVKQRIISKLN